MHVPVVVVLAFDGISAFHLSIPCAVFGSYGGVAEAPRFRLIVCSAEEKLLRTTSGFSVAVEASLEAVQHADVLIVPSWRDPSETPPQALLDAVRDAHKRGVRVVGLCLGAYVLAAAGVLDGRSATTHFAWAKTFAHAYPKVRVEPSVLYIDDGNVTTSAGTGAGIDCCLHVLRDIYGAKAANFAAKRLVIAPHRQGKQKQIVQQPLPTENWGMGLVELLDELRANIAVKHSADLLASKLAVSRRTFNRRFLSLTGCSLGEWLLAERLRLAQVLLETSQMPLDLVAEQTGFGSSASFRQHFGRTFGLAPSIYRRRHRDGETVRGA